MGADPADMYITCPLCAEIVGFASIVDTEGRTWDWNCARRVLALHAARVPGDRIAASEKTEPGVNRGAHR